jgi:hypothetical protein
MPFPGPVLTSVAVRSGMSTDPTGVDLLMDVSN